MRSSATPPGPEDPRLKGPPSRSLPMHYPMSRQGPKPVAHGGRAMVSSSHPAVTKAMVDVLRDGALTGGGRSHVLPLERATPMEPLVSGLQSFLATRTILFESMVKGCLSKPP